MSRKISYRPASTRRMRRIAFRTRDHIYFRILDFDKVRGYLSCDRMWHCGPWPASWRGSAIVGYPVDRAYRALAELRRLRLIVLPIGRRSRNLRADRITMNLNAPYGWADMNVAERTEFIEDRRR